MSNEHGGNSFGTQRTQMGAQMTQMNYDEHRSSSVSSVPPSVSSVCQSCYSHARPTPKLGFKDSPNFHANYLKPMPNLTRKQFMRLP